MSTAIPEHPTAPCLQSLQQELQQLQERLNELDMECRMLRQAADYFYRENLRLTTLNSQ